MHGDVVTQEKGGRLERELESIIQLLELRFRRFGRGIHSITIVHVHDDVQPGPIRQMLPEIARIELRLLKLLHLCELTNERAIPNAPTPTSPRSSGKPKSRPAGRTRS